MTTESGPTPTKLALRRCVRAERAARAARAAREPERRAAVERSIAMVALELPALRAARCVALYASRAEEPGTGRLRAALRARGTRVLLPVTVDAETLDWAEDDGGPGRPAAFGIEEPAGPRLGPAVLGGADVVVVPALAVDTTGTRLGHGRGYYDRALAHAAPDALLLALVHDEEVLDAAAVPVPRDPHDVPVHGVLTPTRWMFLRDRR